MDDDTSELPPADAKFIQDVTRLADMSETLSKQIPKLADSVRKKLRIVAAVFVMFALAFGLAVDNVLKNRAASRQFRLTVTKSLCPIDKIFVDALTPEVRALQPPDKLAYYDAAVKAINDAYDFLKCPPDPSVP